MDEDIFAIIEAARITPDGKACVRKAREIAELAVRENTVDVEVLAESRQWLKLGLEHDKATDTKLLREIKERLDRREQQRQQLADARSKKKAKQSAEGAPDGAA